MQLRPDQLSSLAETAVNPFLLIDLAGDVLWASASIRELLGHDAEALVGRSALDLVSPASHDAAVEALANAAEEARRVTEPPIPTWEGVGPMFDLLRADGTTITCALSVASAARTGLPGVLLQLGRANASQAMEAVLVSMGTGEPVAEVLAHVSAILVGELPDADVTVVHRTMDTDRLQAASDRTGLFEGTGLPSALSALWSDAASDPGAVVELPVSQLPAPLGPLAAERGYRWVAILAVDPLPGQSAPPAALTIWSRTLHPMHFLSRQRAQRSGRLVTIALRWEWGRRALEWSATHDGLTGLYNRTAFMAELHRSPARRASDKVGVLYLDLDDFKPVNDSHGHAMGDRVLTEVAARLRAVVRPQDMVARLGGDEFAVLCPGLHDTGVASKLAERLVTRMREPFRIDGVEVRIGISAGIGFLEHPEDAERVLSLADGALRAAKAEGKSRWQVA